MKKLISFVLAMTMCLFLVACGNEPKPAINSSSEQSSGQNSGENSGGPLAKTVNLSAVAGGTGGSWYSTLAVMSELVNGMNYGVHLKVMPGGGLSNPATISSNEFQLGWTHSVLAKAAVEGKLPFAEAYAGLNTLATSFNPHMVQITATKTSGYTSLEEIFTDHLPARFCTGTQSTITGWLFTEILKYYNVTEADINSWGGKVIYTSYGDWTTLAQDNQIDVMFDVIGVPASTTREIQTSTPLNFIAPSTELCNYLIDQMGFVETTISAALYDGLDRDIHTVGAGIELSVNADLDDATVYALLECLGSLNSKIVKIHSSLAEFNISKAWQNPGAPLHPAAVKFYKDKGYMA